ncbi:helix-turn-helix domain-containing protein [Aliagarivorans taiwanensis]|uniref:helix-turn-helix domain-containing protein n=1 Tax=Aliagarivorans taiwanensis TaxID=561966 RepID=UPI0003FA6DF1|nr:helix-turn-helix domain-containing protein [Aliagarivorans taiwanensis]
MAAAKLSAVSEQAIIHAKQVIVSHALFAGVGGKLPTNVQLLEEHGIVAGTIQRALQILSASEALVTRSKGHMGERSLSSTPVPVGTWPNYRRFNY